MYGTLGGEREAGDGVGGWRGGRATPRGGSPSDGAELAVEIDAVAGLTTVTVASVVVVEVEVVGVTDVAVVVVAAADRLVVASPGDDDDCCKMLGVERRLGAGGTVAVGDVAGPWYDDRRSGMPPRSGPLVSHGGAGCTLKPLYEDRRTA